MNGAPLPSHRSVSASVAEPATPILSDQCTILCTGLSRPNALGPFPFVLSLFLLGMFAREDDVLMIPFIGTGFGGVEERIVSPVVVWDDAPPWFESIATLVGKCTILALVSIQETCCPAPITGSPFSSFWGRWVVVRSGRAGEGHAWSIGASYESWDNTQRRFRSSETLVNFHLSGVGSTFLLNEFSSFKVDCLFSCFETLLPFFQVAKLTL
jgi:hypothetical protein